MIRSVYEKGHIVNSNHVDDIATAIRDKTNELTLILYGANHTAIPVKEFLETLQSSGSIPTAIYILEGILQKNEGDSAQSFASSHPLVPMTY